MRIVIYRCFQFTVLDVLLVAGYSQVQEMFVVAFLQLCYTLGQVIAHFVALLAFLCCSITHSEGYYIAREYCKHVLFSSYFSLKLITLDQVESRHFSAQVHSQVG